LSPIPYRLDPYRFGNRDCQFSTTVIGGGRGRLAARRDVDQEALASRVGAYPPGLPLPGTETGTVTDSVAEYPLRSWR
jgi:hypothetical protein